MKAWSFTLIALASLAVAGSLQAASGNTASSDRTKPERSTWRQAQSGKYLCMVQGAQGPSQCVTEAACQRMGGVIGATC